MMDDSQVDDMEDLEEQTKTKSVEDSDRRKRKKANLDQSQELWEPEKQQEEQRRDWS